jgi:hypothetical protein
VPVYPTPWITTSVARAHGHFIIDRVNYLLQKQTEAQ